MRPATGSNPLSDPKKVSIQLKLGGHSFSDSDASLPADAAAGDVEFVLLTEKSVLVPREHFDPACAADYLAVNGVPCAEDETAVSSDPARPIVAVMAIASGALDVLRRRFGAELRFTTPLLADETDPYPVIRLHAVDDRLLYISVFDDGLQLAEVFPTSGADDELSLLQRLEEQFDPDDFLLRLTGDRLRERRKMLKRYYSEVTCES